MAGGATIAGIACGSLFSAEQARADALSKKLRDKLTPEQIVQVVKNGKKPAMQTVTTTDFYQSLPFFYRLSELLALNLPDEKSNGTFGGDSDPRDYS